MRALLRGEGILRPSARRTRAGVAAASRATCGADARARAPVPAARRDASSAGRRTRCARCCAANCAATTSSSCRNREPYIHVQDGRRASQVQRPASGLVTALEPVMRACSGTWIAHGSGSADRDTVDEQRSRRRAARRARLSHAPRLADARGGDRATTTASPTRACGRSATSRTCARRSAPPTGSTTAPSTRSFADAVVQEATTDGPDRARAGLPLRAAAADDPRAAAQGDDHHVLAHPVAESRSRSRSARGATSCSTACSAATSSASTRSSTATTSSTPSTACSRRASIARRSPSRTAASAPPCIAIRSRSSGRRRRWPGVANDRARPRATCACASACRGATGIGVGVDRLDYTKGILERFSAVERLLELRAAVDRAVHVRADRRAVARDDRRLPGLRASACDKRVARDQRRATRPPRTRRSSCSSSTTSPNRSTSTYRAADVCFVSSLHDGMNLVAKEFVAARDDERGVLDPVAVRGRLARARRRR